MMMNRHFKNCMFMPVMIEEAFRKMFGQNITIVDNEPFESNIHKYHINNVAVVEFRLNPETRFINEVNVYDVK